MDKVTGNKAVIASGANFKGQIKNTPSIEINGTVEADINAEKLTIGEGGKFVGAANVELVVISGHYDGNMDAGSIWATATAEISGKIQYKTIQLDRGAALNCRFIHNWKQEKVTSKKNDDLVSKKGGPKKDGIDMRATRTLEEPSEVDKKNKEILKYRTKAAESVPKSVSTRWKPNKNDDDFKLFADWAKKAPKKIKNCVARDLAFLNLGSEQQNSQMFRVSGNSLSSITPKKSL